MDFIRKHLGLLIIIAIIVLINMINCIRTCVQ